MNRDRALGVLRHLRPSLEGRGVAHAGLFGSTARGDAGAQSDVDIVVTPHNGRRFDLLDLGGIQVLLEQAFDGHRVDLVAEPVMSSPLRQALSRDRVNAF